MIYPNNLSSIWPVSAFFTCRGSAIINSLPWLIWNSSLSIWPNSIPKNDTKRAGEQLKTNQFGVQYADLEQGTGLTPGENGLTMIHYVGWLPDGTMFYNSISRGQPIQFHMGDNKVIPGIQYGLVGMKVGGTRKMMIPAKLAWGAKGLEGKVPPNTPVVCVVKLLTTGRQVGRQFLKPSEVSGTTESPASQE